MTKNGNKSITWTSFNKPKQFTKGTDSTTFTYGPDRSRYQKVQTAFASFTEGCVTHSLNDVALSIGDGVNGAKVIVVEVAGFVRDGGCLDILQQTKAIH
jgi:hypothetical protein